MHVYIFGDIHGRGNECHVTGVDIFEYITNLIDQNDSPYPIDVFIERSHKKCPGYLAVYDESLYAMCRVMNQFAEYHHDNARIHFTDYREYRLLDSLIIDNKPIVQSFKEMGPLNYTNHLINTYRNHLFKHFYDETTRLHKQHDKVSNKQLVYDIMANCIENNSNYVFDKTKEYYRENMSDLEIYQLIELLGVITNSILLDLYTLFRMFRSFKLKPGESNVRAHCHNAIIYVGTAHASAICDILNAIDYLKPHVLHYQKEILMPALPHAFRCVELPQIMQKPWINTIVEGDTMSNLQTLAAKNSGIFELILNQIMYASTECIDAARASFQTSLAQDFVVYTYNLTPFDPRLPEIPIVNAFILYSINQCDGMLEIKQICFNKYLYDTEPQDRYNYIDILIEYIISLNDTLNTSNYYMMAYIKAGNQSFLKSFLDHGFISELNKNGSYYQLYRAPRIKPLQVIVTESGETMFQTPMRIN